MKPRQCNKKEETLVRLVMKTLERDGWTVFRFRPELGYKTGKMVRKGFPDLMCLKSGRVVFLEVKSYRANYKKEQKAVLEDMQKAGTEAYFIHRLCKLYELGMVEWPIGKEHVCKNCVILVKLQSAG